ncbi:hypothetical protein Trydic_g13663 [Trypoxylus dichotomus]
MQNISRGSSGTGRRVATGRSEKSERISREPPTLERRETFERKGNNRRKTMLKVSGSKSGETTLKRPSRYSVKQWIIFVLSTRKDQTKDRRGK